MQFHAVVVRRNLHREGICAGETIADQCAERTVYESAAKWIKIHMMAVARFHLLDQDFIRRRHLRPTHLHFQDGRDFFHLRAGCVVAETKAEQLIRDRGGKFGGERRFAALPRWNLAVLFFPLRDLHGRDESIHANELPGTTAEDEAFARLNPGDEPLLHAAEAASVFHPDRHRRIGDDGADVHFMRAGQ